MDIKTTPFLFLNTPNWGLFILYLSNKFELNLSILKMDYITYFNRTNYVLELIKNGQLRSPKDLAVKFDCNEKTVRNMINHLRDMGHHVTFCRKNGKYMIQQ